MLRNIIQRMEFVMTKMTSRDIQARQTKEKIINTCTRLMESTPWDQIKIRDICAAADLSIGAFYHYFKNKSEILIEIDTRMGQHFYDDILTQSLAMSPDQGLLHYMCCQTPYYTEIGVSVFRNMFKAQLEDPRYGSNIDSRVFYQGVKVLLEKAVQEGMLSEEIDMHRLVQQIISVNYGIYYFWCLMDGQIDISSYAEETLRLFLSSVFHHALTPMEPHA